MRQCSLLISGFIYRSCNHSYFIRGLQENEHFHLEPVIPSNYIIQQVPTVFPQPDHYAPRSSVSSPSCFPSPGLNLWLSSNFVHSAASKHRHEFFTKPSHALFTHRPSGTGRDPFCAFIPLNLQPFYRVLAAINKNLFSVPIQSQLRECTRQFLLLLTCSLQDQQLLANPVWPPSIECHAMKSIILFCSREKERERVIAVNIIALSRTSHRFSKLNNLNIATIKQKK